jgi:hypothetical protein
MNNRSIVVEVVKSPSIDNVEVYTIEETDLGWARPIIEYIKGKTPEDREIARKLARQAANYTIVGDILYDVVSRNPSCVASRMTKQNM